MAKHLRIVEVPPDMERKYPDAREKRAKDLVVMYQERINYLTHRIADTSDKKTKAEFVEEHREKQLVVDLLNKKTAIGTEKEAREKIIDHSYSSHFVVYSD